jgi:hypothetical protein
MDPLSDVLSLLRVRNSTSGGFDAGEHWSLHFVQHEGIKFYAVVSGECWLTVDGVPDPVRIKSGDCFLLPRGRAYRIASDMSLSSLDAHIFFPRHRADALTCATAAVSSLAFADSSHLQAILPTFYWERCRPSYTTRSRIRQCCVGASNR